MTYPPGVTEVTLDGADASALGDLLDALVASRTARRAREFASRASLLALRHLPPALAEPLWDFRQEQSGAALVVRGLPLDTDALSPTPAHWRDRIPGEAESRAELCLLLVASALGEVFAWSTLQRGRLVQDVLPIRGEEDQQSGHGAVSLDWHTEDAFHPLRCDYLTLLCLRNLNLVPTTFASVDCVDIDPAWLPVLREPRFLIRPDDEHLRQAKELPAEHQAAIAEMREQPSPCPVLFGRTASPYLRIDPYFMSAQPADEAAARALAHVTQRVDAGLGDVALAPGELLIIDNYKSVHGRRPYQPQFDGRDRWLKKAIVSRDLRKYRAAIDGMDNLMIA